MNCLARSIRALARFLPFLRGSCSALAELRPKAAERRGCGGEKRVYLGAASGTASLAAEAF